MIDTEMKNNMTFKLGCQLDWTQIDELNPDINEQLYSIRRNTSYYQLWDMVREPLENHLGRRLCSILFYDLEQFHLICN